MSQPVDAIPTEQSEQPSPATPNNLPLQPTPLIGRKQEAERVCRSLLSPDVRLFTLTGPPGVGKTRLSLHVASSLLSSFPDGVFFVNLAPISDPGLVASEIARNLDVREAGGQSSLESLKAYLRDKRMLLVLDNFEQVIEAAPIVAELAQASPGVKLLVTSRMRLQLRGEHEFPVPPLQLPEQRDFADVEALSHYEAVILFTQRARATQPNFNLTDGNASAVARICIQLDGLPLAIELAAARVKLLPAQAILLRLARPLSLLTGGAQDLPARQQTLRNAIEWSHDLLSDEEKVLYRRLSVFVGGWTLEAAEAVCIGFHLGNEPGDQRPATLEGLARLLDKSLVRRVLAPGQEPDADGEPRFAMLETILEYAGEKLAESGEQEAVKRRHTLFFLRLAVEADIKKWGPEDVTWLARLDEEHDNMRAALQWSQGMGGDAEIELRLVVALGRFWEIRGYLSEGRERIASVLSRPETKEKKLKPLRAWALVQTGGLAFWQSDYPAARSAWEEALVIFQELGDRAGVARTLTDLGDIAREEGDYDMSVLLQKRALAVNRELGDIHGTAVSLVLLGWAEMRPGYFSQATTHMQEALALARQIESPNRIALALSGLGETMVRQGMQDQAITVLDESLTIRRRTGYRWGIAATLGTLGWAALRQGDYERATELLMESIAIRKELGDKGGVAWCLEKFAEAETAEGHPVRAAHLLGAAGALRQSIGTAVDIADQPEYEHTITAVRTQLGHAFTKAWEEGQAMTFAEAITYAQSSPPVEKKPTGTSLSDAAKLHPGGLTSRECEIAALIAQSRSNAEIAEALVITKRTVETHIGNILSKLGFTSRGQIAAWALKRDLVPDS